MPKKRNGILTNPKNKKIVNSFTKLIDQIKYDMNNEPSKKNKIKHSFRLRQVRNIINIIKKYKDTIKSGEQLSNIKGIGKGTVDRINEILKTGKLKEIKSASQKETYKKAIDELEKVIGIGEKLAYKFVTKYNITSVKDLIKAHKKGTITLNDQILVGLKYYKIYKQNIPREETMKIDKYIHDIARLIDTELNLVITGSYRRQKLTSNDIDILVTHPKIKTKKDFETKHNYLVQLVTVLKIKKFLVDDMTYDNYKSKYMGFCKYKNYPIRRIDIRYVPSESYYTGLIYFTGSRNFNIMLRNLANALGYKLNEYGLYKKKGKKEIRIKIKSESDVFEKLGLEFVPPEDR